MAQAYVVAKINPEGETVGYATAINGTLAQFTSADEKGKVELSLAEPINSRNEARRLAAVFQASDDTHEYKYLEVNIEITLVK